MERNLLPKCLRIHTQHQYPNRYHYPGSDGDAEYVLLCLVASLSEALRLGRVAMDRSAAALLPPVARSRPERRSRPKTRWCRRSRAS